jgi:site-specific recombinase XerD
MSKNKENIFFMKVKEYVGRLRTEMKSEQTINSYRDSLNDFRKFVMLRYEKKVEAITFDFISIDLIREYLLWVIEQGNSVNTRNLRLSALKGYIRFCSEKNIEIIDLEIKLMKVKAKKVHPEKNRWLNKEQIGLVLEQPLSTKVGIRDRFILLFLFSTGVRLNELTELRLKDVKSESKQPYIRVLGKGNKYRNIPLAEDVVQNLKYYLTLYHQTFKEENHLFYTVIKGAKDKMSHDNIQRIAKKYGDMARKSDSDFPIIHPHIFRHSYGAQMYRLGLSLPEISLLMGHANLTTTELYAETDENIVNKAIEKMIGKQPERKWDILSEDEKLKIMGLK